MITKGAIKRFGWGGGVFNEVATGQTGVQSLSGHETTTTLDISFPVIFLSFRLGCGGLDGDRFIVTLESHYIDFASSFLLICPYFKRYLFGFVVG